MAALLDYTSSGSSSPPSSLSEEEMTFYYYGLPSSPRLVARTTIALWEMDDTFPFRRPKSKELRAVFGHQLSTVWEDKVAPKVYDCLDNMEVQWTSIDVIRIGVVGESFAPVILWIGVKPKSLTGEDGNIVAYKCRDILREFNIADVDVEIRESSVIQLAGPMLLSPSYTGDPTAVVCNPLTYTLGLPISAQSTSYSAGTGGIFLAEGGDSNKLLLLTARHAVLLPEKQKNVEFKYEDPSQPRFNVLLLSDQAYKDCLESIKNSIQEHMMSVDGAKARIEVIRGQDSEEANEEHKARKRAIERSEKAILQLDTFYKDIRQNWDIPTDRILGHVIWSPPISFGVGTAEEGYTEDYAIIEVDDTKIDRRDFKGNMIDLGMKMGKVAFTRKMHPYLKDPLSFNYPHDRLVKLSGTIPDSEMYRPTSFDQDGEPCLTVMKSSSMTGIAIGRANGIMSYTRRLSEGGKYTSKEWPILQYDGTMWCDTFSEKGDSGAAIVDGLGRMGGLLTSGCGDDGFLDITYATPINFLLKRIRANGFPNAHLNLA